LFNHSGGADIIFIFSLVICASIHLIVLIIKIILGHGNTNASQWTYLDLLAFMGIVLIFFFTADYYLKLVWTLTSALRS
jgi:hypothetical protein